MIVLLELLTVLLEYIALSVIAAKDSYYYTNILPIMLALCSMLSGTYYSPNYASIIGGSLLRSSTTVNDRTMPNFLLPKFLLVLKDTCSLLEANLY